MEEYFRKQSCSPNARSVRSHFMAYGRGVAACLLTGLQ